MPDLKVPLTNPNAARAPRISVILEERHPDPNDDSFEVTWQAVRLEWFSTSSTTPARSATLIQRIEGRVQGDFYTKDIYRIASSTEREKIQALIGSMEGTGQEVATELPELIYSEVNR